MKCGIIGLGKMGEAILKGLLPQVQRGEITLAGYEVSDHRKRELKGMYPLTLASSLQEVLKETEVILIAVKPQQMDGLLAEMGDLVGGKLLLSIAAGISSSFIQKRVSSNARIVRVMPNTPALVGEGALAYALGPNTGFKEREIVERLLSPLGIVIEVSEDLMDAVTALSGSGPAYVFLFFQALSDAGVKVGLPRDLARTLVLQTVKGSLQLLEELKGHPALMMEMVTSPGGTTIAALHAMERAGIRGIIMDGVEAAVQRSKELAKE